MKFLDKLESLAKELGVGTSKGARAKVVKVQYGLLNSPHSRNIQRAIEEWIGKGYKLADRTEHKAGGFSRALFPHQGHTQLTFIRDGE